MHPMSRQVPHPVTTWISFKPRCIPGSVWGVIFAVSGQTTWDTHAGAVEFSHNPEDSECLQLGWKKSKVFQNLTTAMLENDLTIFHLFNHLPSKWAMFIHFCANNPSVNGKIWLSQGSISHPWPPFREERRWWNRWSTTRGWVLLPGPKMAWCVANPAPCIQTRQVDMFGQVSDAPKGFVRTKNTWEYMHVLAGSHKRQCIKEQGPARSSNWKPSNCVSFS